MPSRIPLNTQIGGSQSAKICYFRSVADEKRAAIDWQDLRVFLALGRHGSLSAAARALGVNHATIARRLHSLEDTLGEKLVERRPEGFVLTLAGTHTLAVASDMDSASRTLGRAGSDGAPKGLVRINAPPGLTHGYLIAKLSTMAVAYPGLDIDLATDVRSISLERHEADIAVRLGRPDDGDVIAKPVAKIAYGFYATAETCARLAGGEEPAFITFDEVDAHLPEAVWLSRHFPRARRPFRASNQFAQAIAARSGVGVALLPHYIGRAEPSLRRCALEPVLPPREAFLLRRRQNARTMPINVVLDTLVSAFKEDRALFEDEAD
jgi:molybdate transport repressor ModE-like protein